MSRTSASRDRNDPQRGGTGPSTSRWVPRRRLTWLLLAGFIVVAITLTLRFVRKSRVNLEIQTLVESEELILALTPQLVRCANSVRNRQFPDHHCDMLFAGEVVVTDIGTESPQPSSMIRSVGATTYDWPIESTGRELGGADGQLPGLWRPLFHLVEDFVDTRFYFVRGEFTNRRRDEFQSVIGFHGTARRKGDTWMDVNARQSVVWKKSPGNPARESSAWKIVRWDQTALNTTEADQLLFTDALAEALPVDEDLVRAQTSIHEGFVRQLHRDGYVDLPFGSEPEYFQRISAGQHPGVSVVDIDDDGFDDLYVGMRWGRSLLLRNRGDGTFEEMAEQVGLAIEDVTSAIFADFDNDGDQDAMLGRYLNRSRYLVNEGGAFVDHSSKLVDVLLPYLVTSVSAVDYNHDGLLDVYLSTYGFPGGQPLAKVWADRFLEPKDSQEVKRRMYGPERSKYYQRYLSAVGPPNLLLANQGDGRFAVAPENDQLAVWLNTFQSTWSDFDADGDSDVYVCSDFGPDYLFRNDRAGGFVNVTQSQGGDAMMGFGMGVSWGDYDNDGRSDLYISNMYSKAGLRITQQISGLNAGFHRSADGNRMFRNRDGTFDLVSGQEPPALEVTKAGWSWGGQFADFDNDGFLDIYVASGYFTAPKEVACDVDL